MRSTLVLALAVVVSPLVACDASSTLQGTWNIERWTYGVGDGDGSKVTNEAVVEDAGTLEFTAEAPPTGFGEFTLQRRLLFSPNRGSNVASFIEFSAPSEGDIVSYDAGGFNSEEDQITIFDSDTLWNGAWILDGTTLSRGFLTDFGGGQALREQSTLELAR